MLFTRRFLLMLSVGLTLAFVTKWGFLCLLIYDLLLFFLWFIDLVLAHRAGAPRITRGIPQRFYRSVPAVIKLSVHHDLGIVRRIIIRDNPPLEFLWDANPLPVTVKPYRSADVQYNVKPKERGVYHFGNIEWRVQGALGLAWWQGKTMDSHEVLVYPDISGIKRYDLALRKQRWVEMGFRHLRLKGEGIDLRELREYQIGDDIRKIDWKVSARMGHPIIREYEPERGRNLMILLDAGRLMVNAIGQSSRLEWALSAALSLAYVGLHQGDRVGVIAFADEVAAYIPPAKGMEHLTQITQSLFGLKPQEVEADYEEAFKFLSSRQRKSSVVCIFTELTDEASSKNLLRHLAMISRHHRAICITMRDPAIKEAIKTEPLDNLDIYRQAVSVQITRDREKAKNILSHQDIGIVDVAPEELSSALINHYLTLRRRGLI